MHLEKVQHTAKAPAAGGFAARAQPPLFAAELRAAFKSLRQADATR